MKGGERVHIVPAGPSRSEELEAAMQALGERAALRGPQAAPR